MLASAMILIAILNPKTSRWVWLNIAVLILILLLQKIWMLTVIDARVDLLIKGAPLQSTDLHNVFIYSEVLKWMLLITLIILQTKKIKIMNTENIDKMSGHWLLAKVGKKVLRPGGKYLTQKMLHHLKISATDRVVEFAPGLGYTANLALQQYPASYVGIDADPEAVAYLSKTFKQVAARFVLGNASQTAMENGSADKVYGEAMLSMHADHRKSEIIKEAHRILTVGGLYAIHELGLAPDSLDENRKAAIQKELASVIKVNARPLTVKEWRSLLEKEGFRVTDVETAPMHLLEPGRLISDEGFGGFLTIVRNIITQPDIRSRIRQMKNVFKKYEEHLCAVSVIAQKI
ncbi:class I SAM-dependent methyltransferase [Chryseobacterium indoltheticum]|nr:class I SAM-dependent methyltransferase [Chryseobacterium indoltheticum]